MLFRFRQSKDILHAFTSVPRLAEVLPPQCLSDCLPEWWKTAPAVAPIPVGIGLPFSRMPTVKHCYALQELFKRTLGIPLWSDVNVAVEPDGKIVSEGLTRQANRSLPHPRLQYPNAFALTTQHYKFDSPWLFVCERELHFAWTHPFYHQSNPFRFQTLGGIVEYRHQHLTHINVLLPIAPGQRTELSFGAGEMMAYLIPLTERRVTIVPEEVSPTEMDRIGYARHVSFQPLLFNRRRHIAPYIP